MTRKNPNSPTHSLTQRLLAAYRHVPKSDLIFVGIFWCALAFTDMRLRFLPYRWNRGLLESNAEVKHHRYISEQAKKSAQQIATDVNRAAQFPLVFNMSCLRRAIVIRSALKLLIHCTPSLHYGMRKSDNHTMAAHAWLELGGLSIDCGASPGAFNRFVDTPQPCN